MSAFHVKPINDPTAGRGRENAPRTECVFKPQARSGLAEKRELRRVSAAPDANKMMQPHLESQLH